MLTEERHRFILETIERQQSIDIHHVMAETGSSESTVRRDLSLLEKQGRLKRVFGGAVAADVEPSVPGRREELPDKLGLAAAQLIERGSRLFLAADSGIEGILPFLKELELTVVTNSVLYAHLLSRDGMKIFLPGGPVSDGGTVTGDQAMEYLKQFEFDVCVLGVDGLTRDGSVGTDTPEQAAFKKMIASRSQHTLLLLDAASARRKAFVGIPGLEDAHIVTTMDEQAAKELLPPRQLVSFA